MIYLVRHGEAAAGWGTAPDPGLSDLGAKQARAAAQNLGQLGIRHIVSSPMQRCQETSAPFAHLSGLTVSTETAVSEIPTPSGLSDRVAWLRGFMAGEWDAAPEVVSDWRSELLKRIGEFGDNTVVFTHFIAINTIVGHLRDSKTVTSFKPGHCSVTTLEKQSGGLLVMSELGSEATTKVL